MDFELYEKIRNIPCKIHKLIEIKTLDILIKINRNDYILTLKANPFLKLFNSYSQFKENFLKIFKNIDCYKISSFLTLNTSFKIVEITNIDEDNFEELKNDDNSFLILSGVVLMDTYAKKSIIKFYSFLTNINQDNDNYNSELIYRINMTTIESYNNLYNLSIGEDIKIENIEIL